MATLPDGTIKDSATAGTPVNLADHIGQAIDHPNPCQNKWYDESPFSYFRTYHRLGEVLQDFWQWPARLFVVEPLGETGNWSPRHYRYRLLTHQIRVVEEIDAWQALGPTGRDVAKLLAEDLPGHASQWARDYDADPKSMEHRIRFWRLTGAEECNSGMNAEMWVGPFARDARCSAALQTVRRRAIDTALDRTRAEGASHGAQHYAVRRAENLVSAVLIGDRMGEYNLRPLRGTDLDPAPATV
ncbi:hypothetical protein SVTN_40485 (plasmid) [Streptomyces vietnamensis]|uniref:Uncharacterized protein n=2 Tax=Streptomyces vietnamensis TaxID=362257 RepID=A0A0B5IDE8_9ACTN|nr:hypothetical protein SVTN_40485 [Streptomyces vietnamensis]